MEGGCSRDCLHAWELQGQPFKALAEARTPVDQTFLTAGADLDGLELLEGFEVGGDMGQAGDARINLASEVGVQRLAVGLRAHRRQLPLQPREVQLETARGTCALLVCRDQQVGKVSRIFVQFTHPTCAQFHQAKIMFGGILNAEEELCNCSTGQKWMVRNLPYFALCPSSGTRQSLLLQAIK